MHRETKQYQNMEFAPIPSASAWVLIKTGELESPPHMRTDVMTWPEACSCSTICLVPYCFAVKYESCC